MYHKESGTGNDPFLAGNMLCRRWSLSPLRISALINLPPTFFCPRERLIISTGDARSLASFQSTLCTLRSLPSRDIAGDVTGKVDVPLWIPDVAKNATRKPQRPLLLRYTSCVGKHRVSVNYDKRKLEESNSLFVLCKIAKHVVTFFWNVFRECLNQRSREKVLYRSTSLASGEIKLSWNKYSRNALFYLVIRNFLSNAK